MTSTGRLTVVSLLAFAAASACLSSTAGGDGAPSESAPDATRAATSAATRAPSPTTEQLLLEIGQQRVWADQDGNVRLIVLMTNSYDYPVEFPIQPRATLLNAAGEFIRDSTLLLFDGVGGSGLVLPGETIAANGCFTCEAALLAEEWDSVRFVQRIQDATGSLDYSTEVEASAVNVSFDGPFVYITGTVKNNSDTALDRVSVRVFVYDGDGVLVGAGEASAYEVGPGASAAVNGYGFGQAPAGAYEFEFTVLGVDY